MPLRPARAARRGVFGGPVARSGAVVGTGAVVSRGVNRRQDRREDRRDRRRRADPAAGTRPVGPDPSARSARGRVPRRVEDTRVRGCEVAAAPRAGWESPCHEETHPRETRAP